MKFIFMLSDPEHTAFTPQGVKMVYERLTPLPEDGIAVYLMHKRVGVITGAELIEAPDSCVIMMEAVLDLDNVIPSVYFDQIARRYVLDRLGDAVENNRAANS